MTDTDGTLPQREPTAWDQLAPVIDLVTPLAVRAAATLRVADALADGPMPLEEAARRCGAEPGALVRLLRHLACKGLFTESEPGTFGLTGTGDLLRSDHPSQMRVQLDLDGFGGRMDLVFTGLVHTLRTGEPAWESVFGAPFWRHLAEDEVMGESFDAVMAAGPEYFEDVMSAFDWERAGHVVDVGGGTGELLAAVLSAHEQLWGTLLDLPATAERGRARLAESGLLDRCEIASQSFFDPLPTGGDTYVLASVIHDWPDEDAVRILRRCAEAAGRSGRVLILEGHGSDGGDPAMFAEMDLRMYTIAGGRERTLEEFRVLIGAAGLAEVAVRGTALDQIGIECVPVAG
ncbi:methyltransferase [Janibacter corallicola]|uniref:methyltransferase n=1 Tax=Janibacter corallicola TaxID=415212 RepID=UPI00082ED633|nr:methyltransferase [Janibacter corallicola]